MPDHSKFVFIVEGEIAFRLLIPQSHLTERQVAALTSNPTIMQLDPTHPAETGWTYDGSEFHPPA